MIGFGLCGISTVDDAHNLVVDIDGNLLVTLLLQLLNVVFGVGLLDLAGQYDAVFINRQTKVWKW